MKKIVLLSLLLILPFSFCYPQVIKLKSGKTIEAEIIERGGGYIKVDVVGVPITYYFEDIESIDGVALGEEREDMRLPQTTTADLSSIDIDEEDIRRILKHLGYPEHTWPDIERKLIVFLAKIDFPRLQKEAGWVKSNPEQLKDFISEIGGLIKQEGYLNTQFPHPLIKLLVNSFGTEDIFQAIETSPISPQEKEELRYFLVACSAVSQLGSIVLDLLDIDVKAVFSPNHVFNCIPLDTHQVLFADFLNQVFEIVNITQHYKLDGKYQVLKGGYRLHPDRVSEIDEQWQSGLRPISLKEILNLYFYLYITDDYAATQAIYNNRGFVYYTKGNFNKAISDYNQALQIDSNYASVYNNRGLTYHMKGDFGQAISDYNQALQINPNYTEAYSNRGEAYHMKGDLNQAIFNFNQALQINPNYVEAYNNRGLTYSDKGDLSQAIYDYNQALQINPNLVEAYHNRGTAYLAKGDLNSAISDYNQALQINPNFAQAYHNRAIVYFLKGDYTRAWEDVRKAQALSFQINPEFLQKLSHASGRDR